MSNRTTTTKVRVKSDGPVDVTITVRQPQKRMSLTVLREQERQNVGGFSEPTKMPWLSWSTPAEHCITGSKLRDVEGSVCDSCYACKGNYVWPSTRNCLERRFQLLMADMPAWEDSMVHHITERAGRYTPTDAEPLPSFRWHDSGDLQSEQHFRAICRIAEQTQDVRLADGSVGDVEHWLPTREYAMVMAALRKGVVIPRNLCVRLSAHMKDGPPAKYGLPVSTVHTSEDSYPDAAICPAYTQGGRCLACRNCWDKTVEHVSYPAH